MPSRGRRPGLPSVRPPAALAVLACLALLAGCTRRIESVSLPSHLAPYVVATARLDHDPLSLILATDRNPADPRLSAAERGVLGRYLATLAELGPASTPELFEADRDRFAYLVNAHVAWTLALHDLGGLAPRGLRDVRRARVPLDRQQSTLAKIEDDLLAGVAQYQPRVVLCLNPGLPGGPPLPAAALAGHAFDWQLRDHALRCGRRPGFWELTEAPARLRVSSFTEYIPGLPDQRPARMRRLLDVVPPPAELLAAINRTCGETLSRCELGLVEPR